MKKQIRAKEDIKGWLILPIIGMFLTIGLQAIDLADSFLNYNLSDVSSFILMNLLYIILASMALINIYKRRKLGKYLAIAFFSAAFLGNLALGEMLNSLGNLIWIVYFIRSERVRRTLVE
jgi:hypothetical protein